MRAGEAARRYVSEAGCAVLIADSHCHVSPCWYEPVESLLFQMDRNGVEQAVLIQMNYQADNEYLLDVTRRFPGRFLPVVWIRTDLPDSGDELRRLANHGIAGVRLAATARSQVGDGLDIWRSASAFGLPVSRGGASKDFAAEEFAELVAALPHLPIVLEHLGGQNQPGFDAREDRVRVLDLSRFPNVYIKIHGLGEFSRRRLPVTAAFPFEEPIPPLLDAAYKRFGPHRMMWGSDYLPVSAREGYTNALRLTLDRFASVSEADRELIFGSVALSVFGPSRSRVGR